MRRGVELAGRVLVCLYEFIVAATVANLAVSAWNDHLYATCIPGYLLAFIFGALGVLTVLRPMRAGFLHLTANIGVGAFCLCALVQRSFPSWIVLLSSFGFGSVACVVLLDRVVWQAGRDCLKPVTTQITPNPTGSLDE